MYTLNTIIYFAFLLRNYSIIVDPVPKCKVKTMYCIGIKERKKVYLNKFHFRRTAVS